MGWRVGVGRCWTVCREEKREESGRGVNALDTGIGGDEGWVGQGSWSPRERGEVGVKGERLKGDKIWRRGLGRVGGGRRRRDARHPETEG